MELAIIVYSITLIFFLLLCSIFLVGFLGSQFRKYQLNYSEKKVSNLKRAGSVPDLLDKPVIRPVNKRIIANPDVDNAPGNYMQITKGKIKAEPLKKVKRGSLVKEYYNLRLSSDGRNGANKDSIDFN